MSAEGATVNMATGNGFPSAKKGCVDQESGVTTPEKEVSLIVYKYIPCCRACFNNRSQMTSKCDKNNEAAHKA